MTTLTAMANLSRMDKMDLLVSEVEDRMGRESCLDVGSLVRCVGGPGVADEDSCCGNRVRGCKRFVDAVVSKWFEVSELVLDRRSGEASDDFSSGCVSMKFVGFDPRINCSGSCV